MSTAPLLRLALLAGVCASAAAQVSDPNVRVDAFGWAPWSAKTAVLREAVVGLDAAPYTPGGSVDVQRVSDGMVVMSVTPQAWNGGVVHGASGDRVWTLDLGALETPGVYRLVEPLTGTTSEDFRVDAAVHDAIRSAAQRMFYYQRCGVPKTPPFAALEWTDSACHLGFDQDTTARSILNPGGGPVLDLSGGWHDAGEYGKYVNFTDDVIHDLLTAWRQAPELWSDATSIPLSGNGRADLLDEVVVGLDWLLKMQQANGSVLHKLGVLQFAQATPPSADSAPRFYGPATASATISAAGAFAHGARVFGGLPDPTSQTYALTLEAAAEAAWQWLAAFPAQIPSAYDNFGFWNAAAEDDAHWQTVNRLRAAAHLYALTGKNKYRNWINTNYTQAHLIQWGFADVFEQGLNQGLLEYAATPGAKASVRNAIKNAYAASVSGPFQLGSIGDDPYGAWLADANHGWGSNRTKLQHGRLFANMVRYGLDAPNVEAYTDAAAGYVHYLHGLNPTGLTYFTAMHDQGAPASVTETYHHWFHDGSVWDSSTLSLIGPAPGFLTGGPNPFFAPAPEYVGPPLAPPQGQPILKAYKDWNTAWPENSWQVSECQLSYQSNYLALLASVARQPGWTDLGNSLGGALGPPRFDWHGPLVPGSSNAIDLSNTPPGAFGVLWTGVTTLYAPFRGGIVVPDPLPGSTYFNTDASGELFLPTVLDPTTPIGLTLYMQLAVIDATAPVNVGISNALQLDVRP